MKALARRCWRFLAAGEALTWPHRFWFATIFCIGIGYCYAFPPFQTNDEDAHWLKMWSIAFGHYRCEEGKPAAAVELLRILHQKQVREDPNLWHHQYRRDALAFVGSDYQTKVEGACPNYPPMPYFLPAAVARQVAYRHGELRPGSMLRAGYAARIANWVLFSLAVLLLCRRRAWFRNFTLFFYSIPEAIQQAMSINTDSFLFAVTVGLLLLSFGRPRAWALPLIGLGVGLMTIVKPVYSPLAALGLIVWERLVAQHRWRWRDLAAAVGGVLLLAAAQSLWSHWLAQAPESPAAARLDYGRSRAVQQIAFLHQHPGVVVPLILHQWRDLFSDDLMRGSWLSIFGAFGWSMFTMGRWAYYVLLLGCASALAADLVAAVPAPDIPRPSRRGLVALLLAAGAVEVCVIGVIIGMYIFFSGAFLNRIGADDVIGVQGRYYHIPILLWAVMLLYAVRRREPLGPRARTLPGLLVTIALFSCVLANVEAIHAVLLRFNGAYLAAPIPAPKHY